MTSITRKVDKLDSLQERASVMESGGWVHLTTPLTSTLFDGDSFSDTAATLIDMSAVFGLPPNIRAVYLYVLAKDSDSVATECYVGFAPDTTNFQYKRIGTANDVYDTFTPTVTCDANGDIYYLINASGVATLDLIIRVFAYLPAFGGTGGILVGQSPIDHDHSGDAGDGGTFDAANLSSTTDTTDGYVLTADGIGGAAWEAAAGGGGAVATDTIWDALGDLAVGTGANTASRLAVGTDGKVLTATSSAATGLEWQTPTGGTIIREAIFTKPGELFVGVGVTRYYNLTGAALTITKVHAAVNTAPTGTSLIVDVNIDGVTIFTTQANRASIAAGANTGQSTTMDVTNWPNGSYITADLDQVGSTNPGSDLTVTIVC